MLHCNMGPPVQMSTPDGFPQVEHEWRTSITVIRAAAEILRDYGQLAAVERDRFVETILEESCRLTRTCENLSQSA
jgi:K+-sensing histidine kinase KdpD